MRKLAIILVFSCQFAVTGQLSARPGKKPKPRTPPCSAARTLAGVLTQAGHLRDGKSFRAAVDDCFAPYIDSDVFARADLVTQERFLFEFVDTCRKAAELASLHDKYHSMSIEPGKKYIRWLESLAEKQLTLPAANQRAAIIVFDIGDSMIELGHTEEFLNLYGGLAIKHPLYFAYITSIENWDKALRFDPEGRNPLSLTKVRAKIKEDDDFAADWRTFRDVLNQLREVPETRREAERELRAIVKLKLPDNEKAAQ
jgi:hypothetical protein